MLTPAEQIAVMKAASDSFYYCVKLSVAIAYGIRKAVKGQI